MKKGLCILVIFLLCSCQMGVAFGNESTATTDIKVVLDGMPLTFDQSPIVEEGRTLVPLRTIFEAMDATVSWDQETSTITAKRDDTTLRMIMGERVAYKNGTIMPLDIPVKTVNERTVVPIRFIAESFQADVKWDGENKVVSITSNTAEELSDEERNREQKMAQAYLKVIQDNCGGVIATTTSLRQLPPGLNYGTLADFDGDGAKELYLMIGSAEDPELGVEQIWGFDGEKAYKVGENEYDLDYWAEECSEFCMVKGKIYLSHSRSGNEGVEDIRIEKVENKKLIETTNVTSFPRESPNVWETNWYSGVIDEGMVYKINKNGEYMECDEAEYNALLAPYDVDNSIWIFSAGWGNGNLVIGNPDPKGFVNQLKVLAGAK